MCWRWRLIAAVPCRPAAVTDQPRRLALRLPTSDDQSAKTKHAPLTVSSIGVGLSLEPVVVLHQRRLYLQERVVGFMPRHLELSMSQLLLLQLQPNTSSPYQTLDRRLRNAPLAYCRSWHPR